MVVLNLLYSKHVLNNKTIPNHNVIEFLEETNQEYLANILEEMIEKKKQGNKNEYIDENKEMLENIRNEIKNLEKLKEKPEVNKRLNTGNISIEKTNKYLEEIFHQIY